ncbi:peptide deformylase [Candidatus Daviesbacteria bacterium]|nr:peptide deformylase [Candidatus Daviesbacteria bacterium]
MKTSFLKPNDPLLMKTTQAVPQNEINSAETKTIIKTMLKVAYGEQQNREKPVMVGLAAPQIGIFKRIILVDVKADGKGKVGDLRVYINPEITWTSKREGKWYEGCFSTGRICGIVSRPTSIKIRAHTISFPHGMWERRVEKHTGYVARIFQHEIDHLNGKVFIDHIKDPDKLHWVEKEEFPAYRDREAWRNWPKKYPLPLA